jgi:hypothetical protein
MAASEILLLCCSLLSLLASCILWSPHKQAWMDEIFTWKEVSDPSLWHLYYAIQHGADGGMPLFYTTAWLWAQAFGVGVLTLRLYSCIAMCAALLVTWRTIRRVYGVWATAFGVLAFWGTSNLLLNQNVEARFYGLFLLAVAIAVNIYTLLVQQPAPKRGLLVLSFFSQAALVLTHVLGIIYGALILLALICSDVAKRRFRPAAYICHAAGWLALLVWIPGIRASMAAAKPIPWIMMPKMQSLVSAYAFEAFQQWLLPLQLHSEAMFETVRREMDMVMLIPFTLVFLLGLRRLVLSQQGRRSEPRSALLLVAYLLLAVPVVLFFLSHLLTPVFVHRYFLPSGIGLAIILADFADVLGSDSRSSPRVVWGVVGLLLAISPVLSVLALPPLDLSREYLDVERLDRVVPPNIAVVAGWQEDFSKLMRFSHNPQNRYYFLLDWPAALAGPTGFVLDYHLMKAYRDSGYYTTNIQDRDEFLCSHADFLVLDAAGRSWFDISVKQMPQFEWKVIDSFSSPDLRRSLIAVHRRAPLPFCDIVASGTKNLEDGASQAFAYFTIAAPAAFAGGTEPKRWEDTAKAAFCTVLRWPLSFVPTISGEKKLQIPPEALN